jgi:hypothetical protein
MSLTEAGLIEVEESEDEIGDIKISYHRSDINSQTTDAGVIPIQSMGVVDVDGNDISSTEIMAHALTNSTMEQNTGDYSIRRGSAFVNEYARTDAVTGLRNDGGPSNPNHLLGSFPTLFPYGMGGFETNRSINVAYETHAKWAMLYADK